MDSKRSSTLSTMREKLKHRHNQRMEALELRPSLTTSAEQPVEVGLFSDVMPGQLHVTLALLPTISSVLQHAGVGIVQQLRLENHSHTKSQNLIVRISMRPDEFGDVWEKNITAIAPGEHWSCDNISLPLSQAKLSAIRERRDAQLQITVTDDFGTTLHSEPHAISVLAYNEWLFIPKALHLLAAFCQPNHPALAVVIQSAVPHLQRLSGSGDFSGYQRGSQEYQLMMLEALHKTLAEEYRLHYINPPASFEATGQKIRLVNQVLTEKFGTCLDLAVLQASLWEQIGLHPVIVLVPGHALLALWQVEPELDRAIWSGQEPEELNAIIGALESKKLIAINSTEVSMSQSFTQALKTGDSILNSELQKSPKHCHFIHIAAAHRQLAPLPMQS